MAAPGIVIPIQATDAGKAQVKGQLDNLGSQMSALVQHYNDLRGQIEGDNSDPAVKQQFRDLAEQRKAAIRNLVETFKATLSNASQQGILPDQANVPALAGIRGLRGDELGTFQTQIATEQSKLDALATYYHDAQAAIAAGQPLPPTPAALATGSTGMFGMSNVVVIGLVAVAAYFMFLHNK